MRTEDADKAKVATADKAKSVSADGLAWNEVLFLKAPPFVAENTRYTLIDPKGSGFIAPFWCVQKASAEEEANMEIQFITTTVSTGLSLEVPATIADRVQWTKAKEALQSDVSCSLRFPVMFNTRQLQRGEVLKLWAPPVGTASAGNNGARGQLQAPAPATLITPSVGTQATVVPTPAPASAVTGAMVPPTPVPAPAETAATVPPVVAAASAATPRGRGQGGSKRGGRR